MSKSKFVIDKLAKLFEQGLISYRDLSSEIISILKSKRDEIIFRMKLTSKEEFEILNKRVRSLEKRLDEIKKIKSSKKTKRQINISYQKTQSSQMDYFYRETFQVF